MKILLYLFVSILVQLFVITNCNGSKLVTVWAPKFAHQNESFQIYYMSRNDNDKIEISATFASQVITKTLNGVDFHSGTFSKHHYNPNRTKKSFDVILHKNRKCFKQTKQIEVKPLICHAFIQLNKPIYKPGDEIKLRIIMLNAKLKIFHLNHLNVIIRDPHQRDFNVTCDLTGQHDTVLDLFYQLPDDAEPGEWVLTVVPSRLNYLAKTKKISVQKYVQPQIKAFISTPKEHYIFGTKFQISYGAKYAFGENVNGKTKLTIEIKKSGRKPIEINKDIVGTAVYSWTGYTPNRHDDLEMVEVELKLEFQETISGEKSIETKTIYLYKDFKNKLTAEIPEYFQPGLPFRVIVEAKDFKNDPLPKHYEDVKCEFKEKRSGRTSLNSYKIQNGKVFCDFDTLHSDSNADVTVTFIGKTIASKSVNEIPKNLTLKRLNLFYKPAVLKFGTDVTVTVVGDASINEVFMIISSKNGNVFHKKFNCNGKTLCELKFSITEKMMPNAVVTVYNVANSNQIISGSIIITMETFGESELTAELNEEKIEPLKNASITFKSNVDSKVYLLAFDKRLSFFKKGNDFTSNDVREAFDGFEGQNNMMVFDIDDAEKWRPCSAEELKVIEKGRTSFNQQSTGNAEAKTYDNKEEKEQEIKDTYLEIAEAIKEAKEFRQDFQEFWDLISFDIKKDMSIKKAFKIPDSITSWVISAFSATSQASIAFAPIKDLIVKKDFFVRIGAPYLIRYGEILQVDMYVFNYVESTENLTATVFLQNLDRKKSGEKSKEFEFVKNENGMCSFSQDDFQKKKITVPAKGVAKVSFTVRPNTNHDKKELRREIRFQVVAKTKTSNNVKYVDAVLKKILVEQVGVREEQPYTKVINLKQGSDNINHLFTTIEDKYPKTSVIITWDYLSAKMNFEANFYPDGCPSQQTQNIKCYVEYYRYLKAKNRNPEQLRPKLNNYSKTITTAIGSSSWSYAKSVHYAASYAGIIISGIETGAFSDINWLHKELDYLVSKRTENSFLSSAAMFSRSSGSERHYDTAFALIPFIKYKNHFKNEKKYSNIINDGMEFLKIPSQTIGLDALGVMAYAFALNGDAENAKMFLKNIENASYQVQGTQGLTKCYSIRLVNECNFSHTVFVILTYITLGMIDLATPIMEYILDKHYTNYYLSDLDKYALGVEAISKMANHLNTNNTDININLQNDQDFTTHYRIKEIGSTKSDAYHEIAFATNTKKVTGTISGSGYCTVTTIFETKVMIEPKDTNFDLKLKTVDSGNNIVLEVCAKYKPTDDDTDTTLVNVIYEIETPSGYIYEKIQNIELKKEFMRKVDHRHQKTLIFLYMDQFIQNKNYCVEVLMSKGSTVTNIQKAGVKVYDYKKKDKASIAFYNAAQSTC